MSDASTLERSFDEGRLVRPDASRPSFVDLARALARIAGIRGVERTLESDRLFDLIGPAEHLVFVLVDGLGCDLLSRASSTGFLRNHLVERLQAVFPSTTAAALTSLATLSWPNEHAACGWWMYLASRRLSITTLPFVERFEETPLSKLGLHLSDVLPMRSVWSSASRSSLTLVKDNLKDAAFARYMTGEGPREGYESMEDALSRAARRVAGAGEPTFTYVYLPQLDSRCHEDGIDKALRTLEKLDTHLGWFANDLAGRARLVISADHGMIALPRERAIVIRDGHGLLETLEVPPTGEPTMPIFHVRPGLESRFRDLARELLGDAFALITPEEAERLGLFGPGKLSELARPRLGTFLGVAPEPAALYYHRTGQDLFVHQAVHCGLSPAEMWIPLILVG